MVLKGLQGEPRHHLQPRALSSSHSADSTGDWETGSIPDMTDTDHDDLCPRAASASSSQFGDGGKGNTIVTPLSHHCTTIVTPL
jgi:hypothetical protein